MFVRTLREPMTRRSIFCFSEGLKLETTAKSRRQVVYHHKPPVHKKLNVLTCMSAPDNGFFRN